jgi:hypothetical protein
MSDYRNNLSKASSSSLNHTYGVLNKSEDVRAADPLVARVTQSAANIERRQTFLDRFFPDAAQRAAASGELALVKTEYQFRREALEIARRTQVESLKEACNQYLVGQKAEIRQQVASFLLDKTHELQERLDKTFTAFLDSMEEKMTAAEAIKRDSIRELRMAQLERDMLEFAALQAELADRFRRIVSEGL